MKRVIIKGSLPVFYWIEHLRQHSIPQLMDDACVAALDNIEAQYNSSYSKEYGLEVRLGETSRYVDFILRQPVKDIPLVEEHWIEIDYEMFAGKRPVNACYFAHVNRDRNAQTYQPFLDETLPAYAGEETARALRPAVGRIIKSLPEGAIIKMFGVMSSRGKDAGLRLVLSYPDFGSGADNLPRLGWPGSAEALRKAFAPWIDDEFDYGFAIDVFPDRIGEKLGVETFWRRENPAFVETVIQRLEASGLCLPSKAEGLRRWEHFLPNADPLILTQVDYIKLNYSGGRLIEAKAYLKASSNIPHKDFPAYDQPRRLDLELADGQGNICTDEDALARIRDCSDSGVLGLRFIGGEERDSLPRLIAAAKDEGIYTEVELEKGASEAWLRQLLGAVPDGILVNIQASRTIRSLHALGAGRGHDTDLMVRWSMTEGTAKDLPRLLEELDASGVNELVICGMTPRSAGTAPTRAQMKEAASQIWDWLLQDKPVGSFMMISIETCFSVMLSMMASGPIENLPNRGIERGCEGGRSIAAIRADGTFSPCLLLPGEAADSLYDYWHHSEKLKAHRSSDHQPAFCSRCKLHHHCRPCPAFMPRFHSCTAQTR